MNLRQLAKVLSFVAAAFLTGACGDFDDAPAPPVEARIMAFDAALPEYDNAGVTTTENITSFRVCAITIPGYSTLMNNVDVRRTGTNSWRYSPKTMWPTNDTVLYFFAVSPPDFTIEPNLHWRTKIRFMNGNAKTDLCVAVRTNVKQTDGRIRLNFRHAMAQVRISVKCNIPGTKAYIKEATLTHVCTHADDFFFPDETTSAGSGTLPSRCWPGHIDQLANEEIIYFKSGADPGELLSENALDISADGNIFYVPTALKPLRDYGYITGSTIRLLCKLCDEYGTQYWPDSSTDSKLIPNNGDRRWGYIFFPLATSDPDFRWKSGIRYNYTLTIAREGSVPSISRAGEASGAELHIEPY